MANIGHFYFKLLEIGSNVITANGSQLAISALLSIMITTIVKGNNAYQSPKLYEMIPSLCLFNVCHGLKMSFQRNRKCNPKKHTKTSCILMCRSIKSRVHESQKETYCGYTRVSIPSEMRSLSVHRSRCLVTRAVVSMVTMWFISPMIIVIGVIAKSSGPDTQWLRGMWVTMMSTLVVPPWKSVLIVTVPIVTVSMGTSFISSK